MLPYQILFGVLDRLPCGCRVCNWDVWGETGARYGNWVIINNYCLVDLWIEGLKREVKGFVRQLGWCLSS